MASKNKRQIPTGIIFPFAGQGRVGRRTGVSIAVNARKDSEGFEIFDDYFSDSGSDEDLSVSSLSDTDNGDSVPVQAPKPASVKKRKVSSPPRRMSPFSPAALSTRSPLIHSNVSNSNVSTSRHTQTLKKSSVDRINRSTTTLADITGSIVKVHPSQESEAAISDENLKRRLTFSKVMTTDFSDEEEHYAVHDTHTHSNTEEDTEDSQYTEYSETENQQPNIPLNSTFTKEVTHTNPAKKAKIKQPLVTAKEPEIGSGDFLRRLSLHNSQHSSRVVEQDEVESIDSLGLVITDEEKVVSPSPKSKVKPRSQVKLRSPSSGIKPRSPSSEVKSKPRSLGVKLRSPGSEVTSRPHSSGVKSKSVRSEVKPRSNSSVQRSNVKDKVHAKTQMVASRRSNMTVDGDDDEGHSLAKQRTVRLNKNRPEGNARSVSKRWQEQESSQSNLMEHSSDEDDARDMGKQTRNNDDNRYRRNRSKISIFSGETSDEDEEETILEQRKQDTSTEQIATQRKQNTSTKQTAKQRNNKHRNEQHEMQSQDVSKAVNDRGGSKKQVKPSTMKTKKSRRSEDKAETGHTQNESLGNKKTDRVGTTSKQTSHKKNATSDGERSVESMHYTDESDHRKSVTEKAQKQSKTVTEKAQKQSRKRTIHTEATDSSVIAAKRKSYTAPKPTQVQESQSLHSNFGKKSKKTDRQRKSVKTGDNSDVSRQQSKRNKKYVRSKRGPVIEDDDTADNDSVHGEGDSDTVHGGGDGDFVHDGGDGDYESVHSGGDSNSVQEEGDSDFPHGGESESEQEGGDTDIDMDTQMSADIDESSQEERSAVENTSRGIPTRHSNRRPSLRREFWKAPAVTSTRVETHAVSQKTKKTRPVENITVSQKSKIPTRKENSSAGHKTKIPTRIDNSSSSDNAKIPTRMDNSSGSHKTKIPTRPENIAVSHKTKRTRRFIAPKEQTPRVRHIMTKKQAEAQRQQNSTAKITQEKHSNVGITDKGNKKSGKSSTNTKVSVPENSHVKATQRNNRKALQTTLEVSQPSELYYSTLMETLGSIDTDVDNDEPSDDNVEQIDKESMTSQKDETEDDEENETYDSDMDTRRSIPHTSLERTPKSAQSRKRRVSKTKRQKTPQSILKKARKVQRQDSAHSDTGVTTENSGPENMLNVKKKQGKTVTIAKKLPSRSKRPGQSDSDITTEHTDAEDVSTINKNQRKRVNKTNKQTSSSSSPSQASIESPTQNENPSTVSPVQVKQPRQRKTKIIAPHDGTPGLRRSKRTRAPKLKWWTNERLVYEKRKSGGFAICNIQPPTKTEDSRKRNRGNRQGKVTKVTRNDASPANSNLSIHADLDDYYEDDNTKILTIDNQTKHEVETDCIKPEPDLQYFGTSGGHASCDDQLVVAKAFTTDRFSFGYLNLRPLQEKPVQTVRTDTIAFNIIHGKLEVEIHKTTVILQTGDFFYVPTGNAYSLKNLRNEEARLTFAQIKKT